MLIKIVAFISLLALPFLDGCSDRQLAESQLGEQLYTDLLYHLYHENLDSSRLAAAELNLQLDRMKGIWRRPMSGQGWENCRNHLQAARHAYDDVLTGLELERLEMARIQLDRATAELAAADEDAFERLYMGKLYDFFTTWQEVHHIVDDQMLCLMEWREYAWWANLAMSEWEDVKCESLDVRVYDWTDDQKRTFFERKEALDEQLAIFKTTIPRGDQCLSQDFATNVEVALWDVLECFRPGEVEASLAN